uniref:ATP synthase complex subunit 8 n=1 Tax=Cryphalus piceae TaxID=1586473 RepID=A0A7L7S0C9_9CUCU|nr:ATP synthase F0 subunit 8 [Cryphalus piceae]
MPQMAPLNWLTLFAYFSISFLLTLVFLYSSLSFSQQISNTKSEARHNLNWKW